MLVIPRRLRRHFVKNEDKGVWNRRKRNINRHRQSLSGTFLATRSCHYCCFCHRRRRRRKWALYIQNKHLSLLKNRSSCGPPLFQSGLIFCFSTPPDYDNCRSLKTRHSWVDKIIPSFNLNKVKTRCRILGGRSKSFYYRCLWATK